VRVLRFEKRVRLVVARDADGQIDVHTPEELFVPTTAAHFD
jgi:hypothetical protein